MNPSISTTVSKCLWISVVGLCVLALLVIVTNPLTAAGQATAAGTIAGTVTDPQKAWVVGATVTLTDKDTANKPRTTTTNDTGRYIFPNVNPGTYTVSIKKDGFKESKFSNYVVSLGAVLTLDVAMELGSVAQIVEVTASNSDLQTTNATVGNTINKSLLTGLPSIGGDVSTFMALQPGVGPDGSVAGAVVDQSTFMLDGGNNTNDMDGSMQVYTPSYGGDPTGGIAAGGGLRAGAGAGGVPTGVMPTPSASVEEFKVNSNGQTADFNSSAGAQVLISTKRGTNAWHGESYWDYLDNNFNANSWDNNSTVPGTKLPSFHYNTYGVAGGGPIIPKEVLGGKTYFFANYQGFSWNNAVTFIKPTPSPAMRLGLLRFAAVSGTANKCDNTHLANCTVYNLNPFAVTDPVSGLLIPGTALDPRGIGVNAKVVALWNLMPQGNDVACTGQLGSTCDTVNEFGFRGNMNVPQTDNFGVARLDHDFGSKWHFFTSYRDYRLIRQTSSQVTIASGTPVSISSRPQQPWYIVDSLVGNISPNVTNNFTFSYLRNYWSWSDFGGGPQLAGLGGALEPFGETASALTPYNVNTQSVRTRFWDGHDYYFRDDMTMLHGSHLFTFGGAYQRNWDYHQRSDNGGGINYTPTYLLGDSQGGGLITGFPATPAGVSSTTWKKDYAAVLGIVTDSQIAYTRQGPNLTLNPPLTKAEDKSTIPYWNFYWSDSWRIRPSFTLTYGLGWTLEMPPTEEQGRQIELVDAGGQQLDTLAYLAQRQSAALTGQVYNPFVGFALVGNTGAGQKYPYKPFYGSFSPRVAFAWNPNFTEGFMGHLLGHGQTVIRGGYNRIYGRLNGVDLVLVPLLGTGLIQPVQCRLANMNGTCGGSITPANAWRVGTDGLIAPLPAASPTLPQPTVPGVNSVAAGAGEALDPNFRPNVIDSWNLTIQRQLSSKVLIEFGYIGRRITHEYQPVNLNAVPYMMTLGGQRFDKAYASVETGLGCVAGQNACGAAFPQITPSCNAACTLLAQKAYSNSFTPQPFFESALSGTGYCAGFASCTAATVFNEFSNFQSQSVWSLWSDLDQGGIGGGPGGTTLPGFNFVRSMMNTAINSSVNGGSGQFTSGVANNASIGYGNYHAGFFSMRMNDFHGLTLQTNLTYSKALGTGAVVQASSEYTPNDPFDLSKMYGPQPFDRTLVYNFFLTYNIPIYKGQHGFVGHVLGGWTFSTIFTAGSGAPIYCNTNTDAQAFGSGDGGSFFNNEQCLAVGTQPTGITRNANGNIFANPATVYANFRAPILGIDTKDAGVGQLYGMAYWNMDVQLNKNIKFSERFSLDINMQTLNVFNHNQMATPQLQLGDSTGWGVINGQGNTPRQMEFGVRLRF